METPPPQNQPPGQSTPPGGPQAGYPRPGMGGTPTIRFDVIGEAFKMVFADLGTWVVAALIMMVVIWVIVGVLYIGLFASLFLRGGIFLMLIGEVVMIFGVVTVANLMMANMYRMAINALSGGKPTATDILKFGSNSSNIVVASLLVAVFTAVGSLFCYIPGLIVGGLLMFTLPLVVDRNMMPMEAVNASKDALMKDIVMATIFFFVILICAEIGYVACGIGVIFTVPVLPIAITMLYRDYFGFASTPLVTPTVSDPNPPTV